MDNWRDRESEKQGRCREQNESAARARTKEPANTGDDSFRCECGDGECSCAIELTPTEYAVVRAHATHFAVARNHENPESEQVITENERFAVVETVTEDATRLARRSDPRQRRSERRWRDRRAGPSAGAKLLNASWHKPHGMTRSGLCPACGDALADTHAIHHGGRAYHPDCAPYAQGQP